MQRINFEEELDKIVSRDPRFEREAYHFVRAGLDHTQKISGKAPKDELRHVSGQQLLIGIREYALREFGPMAITVLEDWGITRCQDFGDIVFNMIEAGLLAKTDKDSRADFQTGYDFQDAFRKPFLPAAKCPPTPAPSA
ncbi:MAG: Minf_1886 family protein [Verrucomicrobiota bacterium]